MFLFVFASNVPRDSFRFRNHTFGFSCSAFLDSNWVGTVDRTGLIRTAGHNATFGLVLSIFLMFHFLPVEHVLDCVCCACKFLLTVFFCVEPDGISHTKHRVFFLQIIRSCSLFLLYINASPGSNKKRKEI